jgi:hypothetical protein
MRNKIRLPDDWNWSSALPADRSRQLREPMGRDDAKEQENGFDSSFQLWADG